jgi:hypothetical protein
MTKPTSELIKRVPEDLMWTADDGAHETIPIGKIVHDQAAALKDCISQIEALCSEFDVPDSARALR